MAAEARVERASRREISSCSTTCRSSCCRAGSPSRTCIGTCRSGYGSRSPSRSFLARRLGCSGAGTLEACSASPFPTRGRSPTRQREMLREAGYRQRSSGASSSSTTRRTRRSSSTCGRATSPSTWALVAWMSASPAVICFSTAVPPRRDPAAGLCDRRSAATHPGLATDIPRLRRPAHCLVVPRSGGQAPRRRQVDAGDPAGWRGRDGGSARRRRRDRGRGGDRGHPAPRRTRDRR